MNEIAFNVMAPATPSGKLTLRVKAILAQRGRSLAAKRLGGRPEESNARSKENLGGPTGVYQEMHREE